MTDTVVNSIGEVFPYLIVRNAPAAIKFYTNVFGAKELMRLAEPGGRIGHAQMNFGPAVVMLADEQPERGVLSPLAHGGTGSFLHLHVDNVDEMARRATDAGATIIAEPKTQFYGERTAKLQDPFGHQWLLGQHVEDVAPEEMQRRYTAVLSSKPGSA